MSTGKTRTLITTTSRYLVERLTAGARPVSVDERGQIDVRPPALVFLAMAVLLTGWIAVLGSI